MKYKSIIERLREHNDLKPCIYTRVSTNRQAKEGFSLERQIDVSNETLDRHGIKSKYPIKVFSDGGVTGTISDRPEFNKLKTSITDHSINLIIVTTTDRVGRELLDNIDFRKHVTKHGAEMLFVKNPGLDIYSIDGEFQYNLDSILGWREVRFTRSRAIEGIIKSFEKGNYATPGKPYGYEKVNKKLLIKETEAETVQLIHELYLSDDFNLEMVTEYLRINRIEQNVNWNHDRVRKILRNRTYCDIIVREDLDRTFMMTGIAPVIIDIRVKEKVLELLQQRSRGRKRKNGHCFHQKVFCMNCNNLASNDTCKKVYKYYVCRVCRNRISEVDVEEVLAEHLIGKMTLKFDKGVHKQMVTRLRKFDQRKDTIKKLFELEQISSASWKREHKLIRQERRVYLSSLSKLVNNDVDWFELKITAKQKLVSKYVKRINVNFEKKHIVHIIDK